MNTAELYPHIPAKWRDNVMLALRERGANGATIGDALATVESHCADSGETPEQAFGTPREYASSVLVSPEEEATQGFGSLLKAVWPTAAGLAGMFLAFAALTSWQADEPVGISGGALAAALVICAVAGIMGWRPGTTLGNPLLGFGLLMLTLLAVAGLQIRFHDPVLSLSLPVGIALSGALLALSVVGLYRANAAAAQVVDPIHGDPNPRATRLSIQLTAWLFPLMTGLGLLLFAILGAVSS